MLARCKDADIAFLQYCTVCVFENKAYLQSVRFENWRKRKKRNKKFGQKKLAP